MLYKYRGTNFLRAAGTCASIYFVPDTVPVLSIYQLIEPFHRGVSMPPALLPLGKK